MRRQPLEFLRARLLALYLLSLAAVYGSMLAWRSDLGTNWSRLLWPPVVLGGAALAGAAIHERLSALADRHLKARIRSVATIGYGGALFLVGMGLLVGHRDAAEGGIAILQGLQPAFLLLSGFGRGHLGTILNAFVLTSASVLAGGPGAAMSVTLHGGFLAFFLTADHAARALSEYPVESMPRPGPMLARGVLPAVVVAAGLAAWFWLFPAAPYAPLQRAGAIPDVSVDRIAGLLGNLFFVAVVSGITVYLVLRLATGGKDAGADAPVIAIVQARRRTEKGSGPGFVETPPSPKEWRTRIVTLYVRTMQQLAKWGRRRRTFQTAGEFARTLAPAGPATELTELFSRARYGADAMTEGEFDRASRASREILDHHRRRI
jgi:hypothetical protein